MIMSALLRKRLASLRPCRRRQTRGGIIAEFALILPVMLVMAFGTLELHAMLRASETASRVALQTADLVARETVTTTARLNDMRAMTRTSLGLTATEAGRVVIQISSIGFDETTGDPELRWRSVSGSALPITLADAAGLGGKNESVIQVMTTYEYVSPFAFLFPASTIFRDEAWARPRNTRLITLDGVT
jgi:Flp pilus assembly protein TadG